MACSKMWTAINIQPDSQQILTCAHRRGPVVSLAELQQLGAKVFTSVPTNVQDREVFIDQQALPRACETCSRNWPHALWHIHNKWQDREWTAAQLQQLKTADMVQKIEIALSNVCNQTCMYCRPKRSSEWAKLLGQAPSADPQWTAAVKAALQDYIATSLSQRSTPISYNILGGEPLLNTELYDFMHTILDAHSLDLHANRQRQFTITTNLNVKPQLVQRLLQVMDTRPGWEWQLKCSIDAVGHVGETIRDGLSVEQFAENLALVMANPRVFVEILPTVTALSLPASAELIAWCKHMANQQGLLQLYGTRWQIGINMVSRPVALHVGNLTSDYRSCVDHCVHEVSELPSCVSKTQLLQHLENLRALIGTRCSPEDRQVMRQWFVQQGQLKQRDYWQDFAVLTDLLGPR